jgi:hypothetical protein
LAFDAEALVLARRLVAAVAEVPARAQQGPGSRVRVLLVRRRVLAEVWAVPACDGRGRRRRRPLVGRHPAGLRRG